MLLDQPFDPKRLVASKPDVEFVLLSGSKDYWLPISQIHEGNDGRRFRPVIQEHVTKLAGALRELRPDQLTGALVVNVVRKKNKDAKEVEAALAGGSINVQLVDGTIRFNMLQ